MQKRRSGGTDKNGVLPMTEADVTSRRRVKKKRRKGSSFLLFGTKFWSALVISIIGLLGIFVLRSFLGPSFPTEPSYAKIVEEKPKKLPLAQFSSLSYAFENAEIVALYFAASWCPMSTPVTEKLDELFSNEPGVLLPREGSGSSGKHPLAIVYVSSDSSQEEMEKYSKEKWINVPFESEDRRELKKHFRVCAKRELADLGIERKFEIPTLIVLDALTHGVISTQGIQNINVKGTEVLQQWKDVQQLVRALEDKYIE